MRRQWLEAAAALTAGEVLAVDDRFPAVLGHVLLHAGDVHDAFAEGERVFDGAGDSRSGVSLDNHAVDDDLNLVLAAAIDRGHFVERVARAVDADAVVTGGAKLVPQRRVLLSYIDFDRGHQI